MIEDYQIYKLLNFVLVFPFQSLFRMIISIPIVPFYGLDLWLIKLIPARVVFLSFLDEMVDGFYIGLKFWFLSYLVCAGLIQHKTYIKYVYEDLQYARYDFINFERKYNELYNTEND